MRIGPHRCTLAHFGAYWPTMVYFGPHMCILAQLVHIGPHWYTLVPYWRISAHIGAFWPTLVHFGPLWPKAFSTEMTQQTIVLVFMAILGSSVKQ